MTHQANRIAKKAGNGNSRPASARTSRISDAQILLAAVSLLALSVGSVAQAADAPPPGAASASNQLKTNSNQIKAQAQARVLPSEQLKKASPTTGTPVTKPKKTKPGQKPPKALLRKVR